MDTSLDREQLSSCGADVVYRLMRPHHRGLIHRLRCAWYRESDALASGLRATAASIGIAR
jgi:hypothetical protein